MRLRSAITTAGAATACMAGFLAAAPTAHATTSQGEWCRDSIYTDANKAELQPCIGINGNGDLYLKGVLVEGPTFCDHNECGDGTAKIWVQLNRVVNGQVQGGGPMWINDTWQDGPQSFTVTLGGVNPSAPRGSWYNISMGYILGNTGGTWYDNVQSKVIYYG